MGRSSRDWAAHVCLVAHIALAPLAGAADAPLAVDPKNATWHIGLSELWGLTTKNQPRGLDVYQVFQDGKPVNALGSARSYNTSIHLVREATLELDLEGKKLTGTLRVLVTPDPWVPKDGQPHELEVDLRGELREAGGHWRLAGTRVVYFMRGWTSAPGQGFRTPRGTPAPSGEGHRGRGLCRWPA